jgi:hypothetical protein
VSHYRDEQGLEFDAVVQLSDGRWAAFEVKLGGQSNIEQAAANLRKLVGKVNEQRSASLVGLGVITAGNTSLTRPDGVHVVSLGHLTAG